MVPPLLVSPQEYGFHETNSHGVDVASFPTADMKRAELTDLALIKLFIYYFLMFLFFYFFY